MQVAWTRSQRAPRSLRPAGRRAHHPTPTRIKVGATMIWKNDSYGRWRMPTAKPNTKTGNIAAA